MSGPPTTFGVEARVHCLACARVGVLIHGVPEQCPRGQVMLRGASRQARMEGRRERMQDAFDLHLRRASDMSRPGLRKRTVGSESEGWSGAVFPPSQPSLGTPERAHYLVATPGDGEWGEKERAGWGEREERLRES